jgi:hypothetical protein
VGSSDHGPPQEHGEPAVDAVELLTVLGELGVARPALLEQLADAQQAFEAEDEPFQLGSVSEVDGECVVTHHGLLSSCLP